MTNKINNSQKFGELERKESPILKKEAHRRIRSLSNPSSRTSLPSCQSVIASSHDLFSTRYLDRIPFASRLNGSTEENIFFLLNRRKPRKHEILDLRNIISSATSDPSNRKQVAASMLSALIGAYVIVNTSGSFEQGIPRNTTLAQTLLPFQTPCTLSPSKSAPQITIMEEPVQSAKVLSLNTFFPHKRPEKAKAVYQGSETSIYQFPLSLEQIRQVLLSLDPQSFTEIDLSRTKINDAQLRAILKFTPHIRIMNLSCCLDLTGQIIEIFDKNFKPSMKGDHAKVVDKFSIWSFLESLPLVKLNLSDCVNLSFPMLNTLPCLEELVVPGVRLPSNLHAWLERFPSLKKLSLSESAVKSSKMGELQKQGLDIEILRDIEENAIDYTRLMEIAIEQRFEYGWEIQAFRPPELKKISEYQQVWIYGQKLQDLGFHLPFSSITKEFILKADMQLSLLQEIRSCLPIFIAKFIEIHPEHREQILAINTPDKLIAYVQEYGPFADIDRFSLKINRLHFYPVFLIGLFPNLIVLDLSNNLIKTIPAGMISSLPSLSELNLSGNLIESTPDLLRCAKLTRIDLSHNNLSEVDFSLFPLCLEEVDLRGNPLKGGKIPKNPDSKIRILF